METLIVNNAKKEDLKLLINIAQKMGMNIDIAQKKSVTLQRRAGKEKKMKDEKSILELSKKINRAATQRMFAKLGMDYDSYSR
jgi:transposase